MLWKTSSLLIFAVACSTTGGKPQRASTCKTAASNARATNAEVYKSESGTPVTGGSGHTDGTHSPTNAEVDAAERDNPHAVDNAGRPKSDHAASNDEVAAAEKGNPHSVDNARQARAVDRKDASGDCLEPDSAAPQAR